MLQAVAIPRSVSEAHAVLSRAGTARILAGGTAVMPLQNQGTDDFTTLVSLRHAGLADIAVRDGAATLGACAPLSALEDVAALAFLHPALAAIGSPTVRNMATVGGNLFAKQPYGDFAACLVALGATATVAAAGAMRSILVEDLVVDGIAEDEIVTQLSFDLPRQGSFRFAKAGRKALNTAAIVTVAAIVSVEDGRVSDCRIALGGVATHVVRARSVEKGLAGKPFDRTHVEEAALLGRQDIDPFDDAYASAWYRRRVTPVHIRRALLGE